MDIRHKTKKGRNTSTPTQNNYASMTFVRLDHHDG